MDLTVYLNDRKGLVEAGFDKWLHLDRIPQTLREAMKYSLMAGGKRLRPILAIAASEAVGGVAGDVLDLALSLEMIHTFSLIHDDLPSMDDDDLRRGKPTNHKVFGEAVAILAGDALLAHAFYLISNGACKKNPVVALDVLSDLAFATGAFGMTGGQVLDLEAQGRKVSLEELESVHRYKTGALITTSVVSGAKLSSAKTTEIEALKKYGDAIGLAFQIADDILDIDGDQEQLGKDIGSDIENEKSTYPSILGIEESKIRAKSLVNEAIEALEIFDHRADPLRGIAKFIVERSK